MSEQERTAILREIRQLESAIAKKRRVLPNGSARRIRELRNEIDDMQKRIEELSQQIRAHDDPNFVQPA